MLLVLLILEKHMKMDEQKIKDILNDKKYKNKSPAGIKEVEDKIKKLEKMGVITRVQNR